MHLRPVLMKRFFTKASKPFVASKAPIEASSDGTSHAPGPTSTMVHTPTLQPKYIVPPVPHPCPHDHLAILVTGDGLLIRSHIPGQSRAESHVRVSWGKVVKLEEIPNAGEQYNWDESVVVYGILGVLELYSSEHPE